MQRSYQFGESDHVKAGEWHDALWHQYMNCVDSLRSQNAETVTAQGISTFQSFPSIAGFKGNVVILEAMCKGYGLIDEDYRKEIPEKQSEEEFDAPKTFAELTALLKRKTMWKEERPYLGRI